LRVACHVVPLTAHLVQQPELAIIKGREQRIRAWRASCLIVCQAVGVAACCHLITANQAWTVQPALASPA
jgi:hypothetical protein